jgi:hypothetical protein
MSNASYKYTQATVTVSNAQPGQKISVVLVPVSSSPDDQVNWSTGQPMTSSSTGIQFSAIGGVAVPVNSMSVNGTTIVVYTSSASGSSGSMMFTISAFLVAPLNLQYISIQSGTSPDSVVTFQFPGQPATVLGQAPVAVQWPD